MGSRRKQAARCPACLLHKADCLCDELPELDVRTRLVLVIHHREVGKTTGTGPLAVRCLRGARQLEHGLLDAPLDLHDLFDEDRRVLVLYPGPEARTLDADLLAADPRPVTLVVPDGNWRQAARAARRVPGLERAEQVVLPPGPPTRYRLRREPKDGGLATLEAIARAFGILEGADVQATLEDVLERMVERTLATRQRPPDELSGRSTSTA